MNDNSAKKNGQTAIRSLNGVRAKVEEILLKTVRLYTFNTPLSKGKYRLYQTAMKFCRDLPTKLESDARDGRRFSINLTSGMDNTVFFLGEYEQKLTDIVVRLLKQGDVCLDVGANFGWYSTLFYKHCGADGAVHSFEPVPETFRQLQRNYELMGEPENVFINNLALGDRHDKITVNVFEGEPAGHASISAKGHGEATAFECEMITLDSYLEKHALDSVNFVKLDIEGAELLCLKGAEKLFKQKIPPMFLVEMALASAKNFGYIPNDLIEFMRERAAYDFYAVDELKSKLKKIEGFAPDDIGANVICIPQEFYRNRIKFVQHIII